VVDYFIKDLAAALVEAPGSKVTTALGKEVDFGSPDHVTDLEASIRDLERYRNATRRGTSKRQDYSRAISRMRGQLKAARRKGIKMGWLKEGVLNEGGLGGHLMHLYDNWDLTFGDIKNVISQAESGRLEKVSEKTDGQNIFISWDLQDGALKAARNTSNIKQGGLDAEGLADKFAGRGAVHDAFVNGFKIIQRAVDALSPKEKLKVSSGSWRMNSHSSRTSIPGVSVHTRRAAQS